MSTTSAHSPVPSPSICSSASTPTSMRMRDLSAEILTPRTKIRQLLATVGDSDEEEEEEEEGSGKDKDKDKGQVGRKLDFKRDDDDNDDAASDGGDGDDSEGVEDEEETWKPRGRLAARMMGADTVGEGGKGFNGKGRTGSTGDRQGQEVSLDDVEMHDSGRAGSRSEPSLPGISTEMLTKNNSFSPSSSSATPERDPGLLAAAQSDTEQLGESAQLSGNASVSNTDNRSTIRKRVEEMIAKRKAEREQKENDTIRRKHSPKVKRHRRHHNNKGKQRVSSRSPLDKDIRSGSEENGDEDEDEDEDERGINQKLTQQARPTRKASKKALEDMHRETQRISRNQQLTHQVVTRKKITKDDLFARFAFRPQQTLERNISEGDQKNMEKNKEHDASSSQAEDLSGGEGVEVNDTPPSTPPSTQGSHKADQDKPGQLGGASQQNVKGGIDDEAKAKLPSKENWVLPPKNSSKGKGRAVKDIGAPGQNSDRHVYNMHEFSTTKKVPKNNLPSNSDDDELEIVGANTSRLSAFDQLPTKRRNEPRTLHMLRRLAHVASPMSASKTKNSSGKYPMTPAQLQASLQARARRQALAERKERIDELKAKGIIVQTEEERQKEMLEIENLLEKARARDKALSRKERENRKKNGGDDQGEEGYDYSSDEEDGDWNGDDEENASELSVEEEEEEDDDDEGEDEDKSDVDEENYDRDNVGKADHEPAASAGEMIQLEAEEDNRSDNDEHRRSQDKVNEEETHVPQNKPSVRNRRIVLDEEDDDDVERTEIPHGMQSLSRNATPKAPLTGLPFVPPLPMGLTQAFAGSMESTESQSQEKNTPTCQRNGKFYVLPHQLPMPSLLHDTHDLQRSETLVQSSQGAKLYPNDCPEKPDVQEIDLPLTQLLNGHKSQAGEIPEPTPIKDIKRSTLPSDEMDDVPSTIETVIAPVPESPVKKPRKLFRRRQESIQTFEDAASENNGSVATSETATGEDNDAFSIMRKRAERAKAKAEFDKKRSEAKGMFEEQAVESEDEYAGLGGASDDESGGEGDEEMKDMIDETEVHVDERKIAAYLADKERAEDEKKIERLLKDVTNGGLRRKRAADFDLSDSEDEIEAKRRRKRNEFTRMRKALLEDENIGKIAENPKKLAFLHAIEDQDENKDLNPLGEQIPVALDSQIMQPVLQQIPFEQVSSTGSQNREAVNIKIAHEARRPYHERRTEPRANKKPASLAEVRQTLSFVIDDPAIVPNSQASVPEDDDPSNSDITEEQPMKQIVNRISLSRNSTCASDSSSRLAFHTSESSASNGSRVPSLLRRATAGIEIDDNVPKLAKTKALDGETVRRGGSKKSSINYQVREAERRQLIEATGRHRKAGVKTIVRNRSSVLSLINAAAAFE